MKIQPQNTSIQKATICKGVSFRFHNKDYDSEGYFSDTIKTQSGCDSIAYLILTVNQPTSSTTTVSVCKGNGYTFNGKTYFDSGKYVYKLPNKAGCDSLATLVLNVKSPASSTITESICSGESYLFNGKNYTTSGTYLTSYALATGCDSIVTLHLNVSPDYASNQNITLVNDEKYTINGHTYYTEGIYVDVLKTKGGCDSTVTTTIKTLLIPNTLSPNGDGTNDIFMTGYKVRIYNRNGIMMYEGNNGWNGTHNGKRVENDTYFYELSLPGTSNKKRGYLTITG